jgi:lipoprotein-anchoring transpeptidase ErfK/SrfK
VVLIAGRFRSLRAGAVLASATLLAAAPAFGQEQRVVTTAASARELAEHATGFRVVVSIAQRRLWVIDDLNDTLLTAPVAVGSGKTLRTATQTWRFATPRGVRIVLAKDTNPVWIPPDWFYVEVARQHHLRLAYLNPEGETPLADGRALVIRNGAAGVVGADGEFRALPIDEHVIFDETLFVPPIGSANRRVAGTLGAYRLSLGDGFGIHGTSEPASVGRAATHGCLRLTDSDIAWLYQRVSVGTRVFIY